MSRCFSNLPPASSRPAHSRTSPQLPSGPPLGLPWRRKGGQRSPSLHRPIADHIADRAGDHPAENIGDVVIPAPDRRYAHKKHQRRQNPEQPTPKSPCSPKYGDRSRHVLGWKCCTTYTTIVLDEIDGCSERPSVQWLFPPSRHGKPWTLNRERHRNEIA